MFLFLQMETLLEHTIRQHQLRLWAEITKHCTVPKELQEKIPKWIKSGRLSEKAMNFQTVSYVQPDNKTSSLHHS